MEIFKEGETLLKICGVTRQEEAERLVEMGVEVMGFNFWPHSKRYLAAEEGLWVKGLAGKLLRVGVFVNQDSEIPYRLWNEGMIDLVQLHGDETPDVTARFMAAGIPVVKAIGVKDDADIEAVGVYEADGILLDAYAPEVFGGTGRTFDWGLARRFQERYPDMPLILAGGITPENVASAVAGVAPQGMDVASGAEISPGVKDFDKVAALLAACRARTSVV